MKNISIVIAEDIEVIQDHFKSILDNEKNMQVVDVVACGEDAIKSVWKHKPDILLTDIQMDTYDDGLDAIKAINDAGLDVSCIVLTAHKEDDLLFRAFEVGAVDFVMKDESAMVVINSILMAYEGEVTLRPEIASKLKKEFRRMKSTQDDLLDLMTILFKLTKRELKILQMMSTGNTVSDIMDKMYIEESTIRSHTNSILKKFKMHRMKDVLEYVDAFGIEGFMEKYFN